MNKCTLNRFIYRVLQRQYTSLAVKPDIKLLSILRKETQASITKAKEALIKSGNNKEAALRWLQEEMVKSGAKKAEKLSDRDATEGLIGVFVCPSEATVSLIQLSCETDFVARNDNFQNYLLDFGARFSNAAPKCAFFDKSENILDSVFSGEAASSEKEKLAGLIGKLGENIKFTRLSSDKYDRSSQVVGVYAHSDASLPKSLGKIASYIVLQLEKSLVGKPLDGLETLARRLAQHAVGMPNESNTLAELQSQSFLFDNSFTVSQAIENFCLEHNLHKDAITLVKFQKWNI